MGAGQFCTNPGIAIIVEGPDADALQDATRTALAETGDQTMLTAGIADAYQAGLARITARAGVTQVTGKDSTPRCAAPNLFTVSADHWLADSALHHEVFGPAAILIRARDLGQMRDVARALEGQLTCTLQMDPDDIGAARSLLPVLERKAGRVLANGFPTGVEVCDSMVHGGPYPASTNFGATSVGTMSIRRFLRPVCYQNLPNSLLPEEV